MLTISCCARGFRAISIAAAKSVKARLRTIGGLPAAANWARRAETCERCPLRVIHRGNSYCGQPFLARINREVAIHGCGCPTHAKAKDPAEHCPLDTRNRPAVHGAACTCKWCCL